MRILRGFMKLIQELFNQTHQNSVKCLAKKALCIRSHAKWVSGQIYSSKWFDSNLKRAYKFFINELFLSQKYLLIYTTTHFVACVWTTFDDGCSTGEMKKPFKLDIVSLTLII